jgi:putative aldouronate transport system permease protein
MSESTQSWRVSSPGTEQAGPLTRLGMRLFGGRRNLQTNMTLSLMALPGILMLLVFAYLPMVGLVIAFKDYRFL